MRARPPALLALALTYGSFAFAAAAPAPVLPFVEDDYARVLRDARARQVPIFIEAWAPW